MIIIDKTNRSIVLQVTALKGDIDKLVNNLGPLGLASVSRTGAVAMTKGKEIFIEVKTNEVIVPYLIEDIYRQNIDIDKITIISFFPEVIRSVKKHNPKLKCNLLIAFDYKRIEVNEILDSVLSIDANGIGAQNHDRLNEELIGSLKEIGKSTHVWTVDSNKEAERYLKLGINSITTNKPLFLRKHLKLLQLP